jgi:predicted RNA-binding Zn-ribbon protein involved in translation (DUF1610 family)
MGEGDSETKRCSVCGLALKAEDCDCPRCGNVIHKRCKKQGDPP